MKYIVCGISEAKHCGFPMYGRITNGSETILNEKEVVSTETLTGTLEERANALGGRVLTDKEAMKLINIDEVWKSLAHKEVSQSGE